MGRDWKSVAELAKDVNGGSVTAAELVEKSLALIEDHKEFQAIIATTKMRARERANEIDAKVKNGDDAGKLAGVPFIAKDNFLVFGAETTAASNILKGFNAPYQATVVERLESEGAICVAKANLDAFGHGTTTENSDFMTTKNPHDITKAPGGSSGGSASSVVLGLAPFSVATDTGGSIRQPASFTGSVGYKPTYGLMSRSGVVSMASSTDTIGVLASNVDDVAYVVDIISGKDTLDGTTIGRDERPYTDLDVSFKNKKIGLIKEYLGDGLDPGVKSVILKAVESIKAAGAHVEEVSLPTLDLSLPAYYIIVPAEISSNLARYDGQRYGHVTNNATDIDASYEQSRAEGFGAEAKRRIMIGAYVLSSGYYDAYYKKAQTVRTKLINEFAVKFNELDFMIGPVAPTTALTLGETIHDPLALYLQDVMTVAVSLAGLPAISIPAGLSDRMPVGLQIIAAQRKDRELLGVAKAFEELK